MNYYAIFLGHICTANADGSIPLNSKMICKIDPIGANEQAVFAMLQQANDYANEQIGKKEQA